MTIHSTALTARPIIHITKGLKHGPITRLMSPSDLGQIVKPFVFLDLFDVSGPSVPALSGMPLHPHSGLATVTVLVDGAMRFDVPESGTGTISYGGVEWLKAGAGVWHGKEMLVENVPRIRGFQLWLALPAELENSEPESQYLEAKSVPQTGPAHLIIGRYASVKSPVPAPEGINYLLVTLAPGERWKYQPPLGHSVAWLALAQGTLDAGTPVTAGQMAVFAPGEAPIVFENRGKEAAVFVLGSAVPHAYPLHLGSYSVHTSAQALELGERRIAELGRTLRDAGDRRTPSGTIPVWR
ncbi:pirin family protein [Pseudomonas sp. 5P_3.1_Bac2]|uniref:pirin family protein n=1 Tax=Pseudomonas sp. 5P_3.1_Bac2 TaxID=2971617 RepID=UPI0021C81D99|nr:pirin family protein [Pseudomonas sp. 5P_3.1_Bac2]MCU1716231.1 pirin family protein [Pseudomonas sp. 5P_3.1_Bac2]